MRKLLLLLLAPFALAAQDIPFAAFKNYPFTTELCASPTGAKIAWAMDEQGKRNVYVAEGPSFEPRMLTNFMQDDGQEISSLTISEDGKWVVFVRGGDHGANWDGGLPINPLSAVTPFKMQVACIPFAGGAVKYLGEGDDPVISKNNDIAYTRGGQVYSISADSSGNAKALFTARGNSGNLQWSPDGQRLLFVSSRIRHSLIGIYTKGQEMLQWVAPAFSRDNSPKWSPDGSRIVFTRQPVTGGEPDSLLARRPNPWAIYTADLSTLKASLLWKSSKTLTGSMPNTEGGSNLHWAANNRIVFLSYQDGWPHLYSIDAAGGQAILLTPGNFMCEHISLSADGKRLVFSANAGTDKNDIDRRHAVGVSVDRADMKVISQGDGLEWAPVITGDGATTAFISATAQRPPLPAVIPNGSSSIKLLAADRIPGVFPVGRLVTPTQVVFKSADGLSVHAQLFMPADKSAKHPAIVYIHGGPPRQMLLGWHYSDYYSNAYASNQFLASLGFVVLSVNYRLGIGYGYEFHQPPHAGMSGASEYLDIRAAGEWLAHQTYVDASKIGLYGGSYGGYLTALGLARDSKLFAAGVDIHGVHDWVGRSTLLTMFNNSYEKAPDYAKAMEVGWHSSPVSSMNTWKSPVLIIHGDDDRNVSFEQSIELISRLEKKGIPYESMVIVDDTHHWMNFKNSVTVYAAVAEYFSKKFKN